MRWLLGIGRRLGMIRDRARDGSDATQARVKTHRARPSHGISLLDLRLGVRRLVRHWGLTIVGGLAMTMAISMGAVVFGVLDEVTGGTLPIDEGERVVALQVWDTGARRRRVTPIEDFERWRDVLRSLEDVGAAQMIDRNLVTEEGPPEPVTVAEMTAAGFELARVQPFLGRPLLEEDERAGAPPVVVIGYEEWRDRFASDPGIVGRQIRLGGTVHTVVGVMPEGYAFPVNNRFWTPLQVGSQDHVRTADGEGVIFARLAPGITADRAEAELRAVGLVAPTTAPERDEQVQPRVVPYTVAFTADTDPFEMRLLTFLFALLLIPPCANLAILIYARTVARQQEFAARHALGASRGRIVTQLFVEVLVLAALAGAAALLVVRLVLGQLQSLVDQQLRDGAPFWFDAEPSFTTVLFVAGLGLIAAVIAGLVPAIQATGRMMRSGLRASSPGSGTRLGRTWTTLVVAQIAFCVAALPSAAEMTWGTLRTGALGPGFPAADFLTARLELDGETSLGAEAGARADSEQVRFASRFGALQAEVVRQLEAEPGVSAVTVAAAAPGEEPWSFVSLEPVGGVDPAVPPPSLIEDHQVQVNQVDPGFFDAFDIPLLTGRNFDSRDLADRVSTVIVDQTFVRQVLGGRNPLGLRLRYFRRGGGAGQLTSEPIRSYEIVGVVGDLPLNREQGKVYHPLAPGQIYPASLVLRLGPDAAGISGRTREIAAGLDPMLRVEDFRTMDSIYRQQAVGNNLGAFALAAATLSVLLLSAGGMYALMSFTINQRRREIGIRSALGAPSGRLLAGVFRRAINQLAAGALIGGLVAFVIGVYVPIQQLGGWEVPGVLPATAVLMIVVGLLAAAGPARRGLRIEPTEAMRAEV
ncbi:MAG: FtsX-like permease family protein [Gemmatimonas sp.]|nr:FtsX-like permease family protein [Gemmatimonas sp.]